MRQVFWKKRPGSKGVYEARCYWKKNSFFDKNKNKINLLMEVLTTKNYNNVLHHKKYKNLFNSKITLEKESIKMTPTPGKRTMIQL